MTRFSAKTLQVVGLVDAGAAPGRCRAPSSRRPPAACTAPRPPKIRMDSSTRTGSASSSARLEVLLDLGAELQPGHRRAADGDTRHAVELLDHVLGDRLLVHRGVQRAGDQRRRAVGRRAARRGGDARRRCRPAPRARRRRPPASPPGCRPSSRMPAVGCWPVAASIRSTARAESESAGVKPPSDCMAPAIGPPITPASATNSRTAARDRRGKAWSAAASRVGSEVLVSMVGLSPPGGVARVRSGDAPRGRRTPAGVRREYAARIGPKGA